MASGPSGLNGLSAAPNVDAVISNEQELVQIPHQNMVVETAA